MSGEIIDVQAEILRAGMYKHYKELMRQNGVRGAWPELLEDSGGDPVEAMRTMARSLGGPYVGPVIDPETGEPGGESAILRHERSSATFGPPGSGKSTINLVDGMIQSAAAGMHTVLITPQPKTMDDSQKPVRAVSDSGLMDLIDFGGRIVEEGAPRPTTWDPTSRCLNAESARAFGAKLAGPKSPAAVDLGNGNGSGYWLQIPEIITAQAAHLVQIERTLKRMFALNVGMSAEQAEVMSLSSQNGTGVHGVFGFMKVLEEPDPSRRGTPFEGLSASLRTDLTPAQREAFASNPQKLKKLRRVVRNAAFNAKSAPLSLQKLVYEKAYSKLQELDLQEELGFEGYKALLRRATPDYGPEEDLLQHRTSLMDDGLMDDELTKVIKMVKEVAQGQKDPLLQLGSQVTRALPPLEQRMLSPLPGDKERSPYAIIRGPAGFTVVAYDSGGSPGLAAGWFCDELIKESLRFSKELYAEMKFGSTEKFTGIAIHVDEGGAMRYIDLDLALKEGRQHKVAVHVTATSYESLVDEIGPARAAAIVNSTPYLIQYAPNSAAAADYSEGFGKKDELKPTYNFSSDTGGHHVSFSTEKVPLVSMERIKELKDGEMIITSSSLDDKTRHTDIVQGLPFYVPNHPVGRVVEHVREMPGYDLNWAELAPQAKARYDAKLAARQRALELPAGPGGVQMLPDDVQDALDALDDVAEQPAAMPVPMLPDGVQDALDVIGDAAEQPGAIDEAADARTQLDGLLREVADQIQKGEWAPESSPGLSMQMQIMFTALEANLSESELHQLVGEALSGLDAPQPAEQPAEPAKEAPAQQPAKPVKEAPAEQPATPAEEPVEISQRVNDAPAEQPAERVNDAPAQQPAEPVKDAPAEQPTEPVKEAPAQQPAEPSRVEDVASPPSVPAEAASTDHPSSELDSVAEEPLRVVKDAADAAAVVSEAASSTPAEEPGRLDDGPESGMPATADPAESVRQADPVSMPEQDEPASTPEQDEPASTPEQDEPAWTLEQDGPAPTRDEPKSGPDNSSFGSFFGQF